MFTDPRSRRVIFLSHCLLNQNSISDGTADFPGQFKEIIELIMNERIGIIQLPCPEFLCLGLDRQDRNGGNRPVLDENTRIWELLSKEDQIAVLRNKAGEVIRQIKEYRQYGFQILGLI